MNGRTLKKNSESVLNENQDTDSSKDDLEEAGLFYERQGEGLGDYFFDSLFSDIDSLALYAGIHLEEFGYHRLLSKRFPYAAYYKVDENQDIITVHRVLDLRQNPKRIKDTLK